MSQTKIAEDLFFTRAGLDPARLEHIVGDAMAGLDDGELFLEYTLSESLAFDDGTLKSASFDTSHGFGLRGVADERVGYAHATDLSEAAIKRAADTVKAIKSGHQGHFSAAPSRTNKHLYGTENPIESVPFQIKTQLLQTIDSYVRGRDPRVRQVSASLAAAWTVVHIMRPDGFSTSDVRPMVRLNVTVILEDGGRQEVGTSGGGGRIDYADVMTEAYWKETADEALRQADVNMHSVPAPAGEMPVVLGPGWPGVLLHEAIGHGLEGDFNRKGTSAFSNLMGQQVAAKGVTVVDDGSIDARRGSLSIDDEGTPSSRTVLIEDGILKGYMQDRMNARLMGTQSTGNGRRQSFAHAPMPRMTNTFMLAGDKEPEEIIASLDDGIYAVNFGGGQVDITSGKFVFSCTEAYRVRGGKVEEPLKGATLIGSGPEVLKHVSMIGNDLKLDRGVGVCGKGGQSVPAGVGQPTLLVDQLTIGGTQ